MNLIVGLSFIVLGIGTLIFTYKNPDSQLSGLDWKGYIGGFCAIILGIVVLLNKITW
jgi:hypothetical protein